MQPALQQSHQRFSARAPREPAVIVETREHICGPPQHVFGLAVIAARGRAPCQMLQCPARTTTIADTLSKRQRLAEPFLGSGQHPDAIVDHPELAKGLAGDAIDTSFARRR